MRVILVLLAWLVVHAPAVSGAEQRIDFFDTKGRRTGYVIVDREGKQVDLFNTKSQRLGWGRLAPSGRLELFTTDGHREGEAVLPMKPTPERR